jgi:hypothetical protein
MIGRLSPRIWVTLFFVAACFSPAAAQSFSQSFRVTSPMCEVEVKNKRGAIKVVAGESNFITIKAREKDGDPKIQAVQTAPGRIVVEVMGKGKVKLEISVPHTSNLDLLCYDCEITVKNISGTIRAVNTEGEIQFDGVRSPRLEAHSTAGNIGFSGSVLPSGNYIFKSFSGRVDMELPRSLDCRLSATSFRGGIGLGDFPWQFKKQTDQFVEATLGEGRASILIWTQEGTIQVHRKQ